MSLESTRSKLEECLACYFDHLAVQLESCQVFEQVEALLQYTAQFIGICDSLEELDSGDAKNTSESENSILDPQLLKLAADCKSLVSSLSSPSLTVQQAFYGGSQFTTLAEILLHQVAPDWLSSFSQKTRNSLLYGFFLKAPPGSLLLAVVPALTSAVLSSSSSDVTATQRLAQRILVLCLLEKKQTRKSFLRFTASRFTLRRFEQRKNIFSSVKRNGNLDQ